jgi:hypothetical protein
VASVFVRTLRKTSAYQHSREQKIFGRSFSGIWIAIWQTKVKLNMVSALIGSIQPTNRSTKEADDSMVKRHLLFYASSRDLARYRQLKSALVLYRLVFGQPRQQDIVERIMSQLHSAEISRVGPILAEYTINLSPLSKN